MDVCPFCGSAACLRESPEFCRHTRLPRFGPLVNGVRALVRPERDKMMRTSNRKGKQG